jgi:hypothetical protein
MRFGFFQAMKKFALGFFPLEWPHVLRGGSKKVASILQCALDRARTSGYITDEEVLWIPQWGDG